jgi:signal transduction histidine kinase
MRGRVAHGGDAQAAGIRQALGVGTSLAHPPGPKLEPKLEQKLEQKLEPKFVRGALKEPRESPSTVAVWFDREQSPSGRLSKTVASVAQWARTHPKTVDAGVAIGLFALAIYGTRLTQISFIEDQAVMERIRPGAEAAVKLGGEAAVGGKETLRILSQQPHLPSIGWPYLLGGLSTLPLMFRRRFPDLVHPLVMGGFLLTLWVFPLDVQIASVTAWLSTYTFAAYGRAPERVRNIFLTMTGVSLVLLLSGVVRNREFSPEPLLFRQVIFYVLLTVVLYGAPILFGLVMRRHLTTLEQLRSRTATLQVQQLTLQQQQGDLERTAILNERVRIARELHDVVAHHVSVMGMQAGAARLTLGTNDTPVAKALGSIEQSSREAVANLQQLLGFLRSRGGSNSTDIASPQPNLAGLPLLIDEHRNAGYSVEARFASGLELVQPAVALSGYRIVQEALTNIRKHAHRADQTAVSVLVDQDSLHISVTNSPPEGTAKNTKARALSDIQTSGQKLASKYLTGLTVLTEPGLGLRGMNERVELHNGTMNASATPDGGFRVTAALPMTPNKPPIR